MSFAASLRKEWIESWRTRRTLIVLVVLIFFGMTSPLLAKYLPEMMNLIPGAEPFKDLIPAPTLMDAVGQFVKNVNQFGMLLALLLAMGLVAQEKERGTAAMMLSKPLPRAAFLFAKFVSLAAVFALGTLVSAAGAYYYTTVLFQAPDPGMWVSMAALLWVYALVFIAITLLGSVLFRSQAAAIGLGFGSLMLFALVGALPSLAPYLPQALISWAGAQFIDPFAAQWPALWISIGLVAACLLAAWLIFRKQEI